MKLTERDKKLLLMLAYFVIIVGFGAFVFRPLIGYYSTLGDNIALLEAQKEEMDTQLAEARGLEQRRAELADLFRVSTQDLYPMLGSEEVDKEITGIVLSCGMQAMSLNIAMPEESAGLQMYPYAETEQAIVLPGDEAAADPATVPEIGYPEQQTDTAEDEAAGQSYIYAPVVKLTAAGSSAQADELIDRLTGDYPAIRLRSYSRQLQSADYMEGSAEQELLTLELELYMCDKSVLEQGETP